MPSTLEGLIKIVDNEPQTDDSRVSRLVQEKQEAINTRFPHLPDPIDALGVYIVRSYVQALNDTRRYGVKVVIDKGQDQSACIDATEQERYEQVQRRFNECSDQFDTFRMCARHTGFDYRFELDPDGNIKNNKVAIKQTSHRSDLLRLMDVTILHALLDYWEPVLTELDKAACNHPSEVISQVSVIAS